MATIGRPNNLTQVRDSLCQMYADVMNDPRRAVQVHEGANALGKVVNTCKIYLQYCELAKEKPDGDWKKFIVDK